MSWLFSRVLVAEYLEESCSDGAPSAPSSSTPMPQAYLSPDRMTAFSRLSRFGMTFAPLTEDLGGAVLTWFLEASPAKTSAQPERVSGSTESAADYGGKWLGSLAKYDPASSSWKTHQFSLLGVLEPFLATWPRWGSMRNGVCWERPTWERRTEGNESGFWPTVTVFGNYNRKGASANSGDGLATAVRMWPTPTKADGQGGPGCSGRDGGLNLRTAVTLFPTPTATNTKANHMRGADKGKARAPRSYFPTPQARDHFPVHKPEYIAQKKAQGHGMSNLNDVIGGQLNPTWVEWLMGWPQGWTALDASETDRYHNAPPKLSGDCVNG